MTPKITQNITPRRRAKNFSKSFISARRTNKHFNCSTWQKGSISSTTLTLAFGLIIIGSVAVLGFFYLGQVLNTASQGTDIQKLEERLVELKEKQREVELEGARLRSIDTIENRVNQLNLVNTSKVTFLDLGTDKVAALSD